MLVTFYFSNLSPKSQNCGTASAEELLITYRCWSKSHCCLNIIPETLMIGQSSALDEIF